jgi:hypothetical protein
LLLLTLSQIDDVILHDHVLTFLFLLLVFIFAAEVLAKDGHMNHVDGDVNVRLLYHFAHSQLGVCGGETDDCFECSYGDWTRHFILIMSDSLASDD